jgi:anti-sigma B factor antagonist
MYILGWLGVAGYGVRLQLVIPGNERKRLSLSIGTEAKDDLTIVHADGDLDVYTAPRLKETLEQSVADGRRLVLDLSGVQFIDSTALSVLVGALHLTQSKGGDFRLVVSDPFLLKIFHITGFDGMFSIYPRLEDALSGD